MSETPSYSEALQRLEAIVAELERGGTDLEATVKMFEEGRNSCVCQRISTRLKGNSSASAGRSEAELEEPEA